MRPHSPTFFAIAIAAAAIFLACSASARGQDSQSSQDQSVADAAKRTRNRKKNPDKPSKVITDDDLDRSPGGINVGAPPQLETQPPDPAKVAAIVAADEESQKKAAADEDAQIARLKEQIADAEKDLDLLRRQFALDSEVYYSKTNYAEDKAGKANLDSEQQQIAAKQQELDGLKARLVPLLESQRHRKAAAKPAPSQQNEKPANPAPPQS